MDAARRRTWIIVEVVAIVVAVAVGAFLGVRARNSDDADQAVSTLPAADQGTPTTAVAADAPTTPLPAAAAPDTAPSAATTTPVVPPTADLTETTTTTGAPTTTTTLPPLTTPTDELLAAAIPSADDLPGDWFSVPGSSPFLGFAPTLQVREFCDGPTLEQRAIDAGSVAAAWWNAGPPEPILWRPIAVGFTSSDDARDFVEATRAQIAGCDGTYSEQFAEGDGSNGTYDGFFQENPPVTWTIASMAGTSDLDIEQADDALRIVLTTQFSTTRDGADFARTESNVYQYERFGPIVVIHHVNSAHGYVGFDFPNASDYVVGDEDVHKAASLFRDLIVSRLEAGGLIHPATG